MKNEKGEAVTEIGGRSFKIQKQFLNNIKKHNIEATVEKIKKCYPFFCIPKG